MIEHPELTGLKTTTRKITAENAERRKQIAALELRADFSADEWNRLKTFERERIPHKKAVADLDAQRGALVAAKDAEIERRDRFIRDKKINIALRAAFAQSGVMPALMDAAVALLRDDCILSANGEQTFVNTRYGPTPVERYVKNWCQAGDGVPFVDPAHVQAATQKFSDAPVASAPESFAGLIKKIQEK